MSDLDLEAIRARDRDYNDIFEEQSRMSPDIAHRLVAWPVADRRALLAAYDALAARLAEAHNDADRLLRHLNLDPERYRTEAGFLNVPKIAAALKYPDQYPRLTDSASAVQPERCCLDYPRCDCNSPPEPDDDWLCFQRPAQPKVTP